MADELDITRFESIMRTLEVFDDVATLGTGAVLYSRRWNTTPLPGNLQAALAATALGLKSLDHAKKTYVDGDEPLAEPAVEAYLSAYIHALDYMRQTNDRLRSTERSRDHLGTFAASTALQRLESGFRAAHLLYRLGLNVEGDALARQFLEQVAWSYVAANVDELDLIDKVSATKAIATLKAVVPEAGRLYGQLSDIAHAGLAQHRRLVKLDDNDSPQIILASPRLGESAEILVALADAWVVVCETTQRDQLPELHALVSFDDPVPDPGRRFLQSARAAVEAVRKAESTESHD